MRNAGRLVTAAAAVCWLAAAARGQTTQPGDLAQIVDRLGSDSFAERDAAQNALKKVPSWQVDLLRDWEKKSGDEEVKARLQVRIEEMEMDLRLHPKPVSIDVNNATLEEVAAALNAQLGDAYVRIDPPPAGGAPAGQTITLHLKDQPFWEIIRQINEKVPLSVVAGMALVAPAPVPPTVRLTPRAPGAGVRPITVIGGAGIFSQITGNPATGDWAIRCAVYVDPRVRIAHAPSAMAVDKVLDQDGHSLSVVGPLNTTIPNDTPLPSRFAVATNFAPVRELTAVKEFHATCKVDIIEAEEKYKIDLNGAVIRGVDTPAGQFTVFEPAVDNYAIDFEPELKRRDGPRVTSTIVFTVLDKAGDVLRIVSASPARASTPILRGTGDRAAARVEFNVPTKTREVEFEIHLKDLPIPAVPATAAAPAATTLPAVRGGR